MKHGTMATVGSGAVPATVDTTQAGGLPRWLRRSLIFAAAFALAFGAVLVRQPGDDIATDRSALRVLQLLVAQLVMVLVWALAMQFSGAGLVSFAAASGLWLASVGTVYIGLAIAPLRGWLFVPHMLWLCYVAILTGVVWLSRTG